MRAIALGMWLVARSLTGDASDPSVQAAKLKAAIRAVNDLNDEQARTILNDLLATAPADPIAAQAYLYLGLTDFNALDVGHASEELRHALELDPTIDLPPLTSPKIALAFGEIRQQMIKKMARAAPANALAPPPLVVTQEAESHSRVWPWVFGGAAVVAAGFSTWGWIEVSSFESLKGSSSLAKPISAAQAQSSQSSAAVGETVGIIGLVALAGFGTGVGLTW
jgi:hypothetical protein